MSPHHKSELTKFKTLENQLKSIEGFALTDPYGFTIAQQPDILFTGLTHGNEVIGLQVINMFLEKVIRANKKAPYTFAVLLNNLKAYEMNERFVNKDLNRSFHLKGKASNVINKEVVNTYEYGRVREIESVVRKLRPRLIVDLHQTTEPTLSPFFILPEDSKLISMARTINTDWPIVCFDTKGFSRDGHTLSEFARSEQIPAIVIEISQNGFDQHLANQISEQLFYLSTEALFSDAFVQEQQHKAETKTEYFKITHNLLKSQNSIELIPGFSNLQPVAEGEILGYTLNGMTYNCPAQGLFIFPKYGKLAETSRELGLIATRKTKS